MPGITIVKDRNFAILYFGLFVVYAENSRFLPLYFLNKFQPCNHFSGLVQTFRFYKIERFCNFYFRNLQFEEFCFSNSTGIQKLSPVSAGIVKTRQEKSMAKSSFYMV